MAKSGSIATKSLWTIGTYAASAILRFAGNIVLSRILGPEILGVVVIAQAIRVGCDLLTDLGLEQNVVHSRHGDDERFLNTVWTMQLLRGALVSLICLALAPILAHFYHVDTLILIAVSAAPLFNAMTSTALFTIAKRLDVRVRNLYEISSEAVGLAINIALAVTLRNVWAPILGILLSIAARSAMTWFLPHPRHRFLLDRTHAPSIFHFSKWIMLASLSLYAAVYVDRLYLGRIVTLAVLGIYGQARSIGELPNTVAGRLAFQIVFPFVAKHQDEIDPGTPARAELTRTRRHFLTLVLIGTATAMAWSDKAVLLLYGPRYAQAGWMLCLLLVGIWIAVISSLNEAIVFGRGQPRNVGLANAIRFFAMGATLPIGYALCGLPGVFFALPVSEVARYLILLKAQARFRLTYLAQDAALTLALAALFAAWIALRLTLGLNVPWALMRVG